MSKKIAIFVVAREVLIFFTNFVKIKYGKKVIKVIKNPTNVSVKAELFGFTTRMLTG
ncbi:MAG: hypothetical protein F2588_03550 [Actinobacteria bacterium]|nr:hypothetical protein [Actinomycetota bacterium]